MLQYQAVITSITLILRGLGYLEKRGYAGVIDEKPVSLMIACVRLTSKGALYVRSLNETVIQDLPGGNEKSSVIVDVQPTPDATTAVPPVSTHIVERIRESKWTMAGVILTAAGIVIAMIIFLIQHYNLF